MPPVVLIEYEDAARAFLKSFPAGSTVRGDELLTWAAEYANGLASDLLVGHPGKKLNSLRRHLNMGAASRAFAEADRFFIEVIESKKKVFKVRTLADYKEQTDDTHVHRGVLKMLTMFDYTTVLVTLQQVAPEAHIAGGAVRDTILQKQIHDIDVFMKDEHVEEAAALLRSSCSYVKVGEWKQYLGFSDPAMTRVAKFEKADEIIPICIIGLLPRFANPKDNIARFDFGLCMAAFDGKQTIRAAEFDQDEEAHSFTLFRADNQTQFNYSLSRFEKIAAARFKGWSLSIPREFEEFAKERTFRRHWYRDSVKGFDGKTILKPKERIAAHQ
jgi:hypothetical protein